jgi:hypothetical protein
MKNPFYLLFYTSFFTILLFYIIFTIYIYNSYFFIDCSNIQLIYNLDNHQSHQLYFEINNNIASNQDESSNQPGCIPIKHLITNISFVKIKNNIKFTSKNAVHKIKVFERTVS